jgi:hypothetical protein
MKLIFDRRVYRELSKTFSVTIFALAAIVAALLVFFLAGWPAG